MKWENDDKMGMTILIGGMGLLFLPEWICPARFGAYAIGMGVGLLIRDNSILGKWLNHKTGVS